MSMEPLVIRCTRCGDPVDMDEPQVGRSRDQDHDGSWVSYWIPWPADLRGGPTEFVHPLCFAESAGVEVLLELVVSEAKRRRR